MKLIKHAHTQPFNFSIHLVVLFIFIIQVNSYSQNLENISEQTPVKLTGGASLNMSFYHSSDSVGRRGPFSYTIAGSPTLSLYGITMPFSFIYSDEASSFSQPFSQFGISPYYKWIKLHLGYSNVSFSPFTLAGHTFFGGGIELTPGILRFGFVYGRFQKAIPEDTQQGYDTLLYNPPLPAYKRKAYAIKLGIGSEKNYLDLIYMKGKDDSTSLPSRPADYYLTPGEDAVLGISYKITIAKKVTWKTDAAVSLYTTDMGTQSLDVEDFPLFDALSTIIKPNISTQVLTAGESSLAYKDRYFGLQLKYRRIDPDYKSMGVYYFQTDLEQYTIAPTFNLFKFKLMINSSIGYQRDNLYNRKLSTSARKIGSLNINLNASQKFGINFQYSNYGITQNPALARRMPDSTYHRYDSLLISQVSQNIVLSPRLNFNTDNCLHAFNLFVGYQALSDNNKNTRAYSEMKSINVNLSYNLLFLKNKFTLTSALLYNSAKTQPGLLQNVGGTISTNKPFLKNALYTNASLSFTKNYFRNAGNGYTLSLTWALTIKPFKSDKQGFTINAQWMKNRATDQVLTRDFSEFTGTFGYNINF